MQSSGVISPRTSMTQQMLFEQSAGGAGDASQSSRWERVSGRSWAAPLSIHCLRGSRFASDMRGCLEQRIFVFADETVNFIARKRVEIDLGCRGAGLGCAYRRG